MPPDALSDEDQELLGETPDDIQNTLRYRDEVLTGKPTDDRRMFAPPTLDGATLLFSRYGFQGTGILRAFDTIFVE